MKAKNILKTLALPVAVALGMMATSCSSDDNIVNEQQAVAAKHEIPVTVSATRSDEGTRATFNGTSKKLEFEEGDKLFIQGTDATAGTFAGVLSNTSGAPGTFSGTVTTNNEYTGTSADLFANATSLTATLLPKDYSTEAAGYLTLSGTGASQTLAIDATKAFVTAASADAAKALAIEQLSLEQATTYSSGKFALAPVNAVLSYSISGLANSTGYTPSVSDAATTISGSVTSDASGNAYFAVAFAPAGSKTYTLSISGFSDIAVADRTLTAGKVYNKTAAVAAPAPAPSAPATLSELKTAVNNGTDCSSYVGWEVDSDGKIAESNVSGTKIGYVAYVSTSDVDAGVSDSRILVIASADAGTNIYWGGYETNSATDVDYSDLRSTTLMNGYTCTQKLYTKSTTYNAAESAWEYSASRPSGASGWFLPSMRQWMNMGNAQSGADKQTRRNAMNSAFGLSGYYWSSTEANTIYSAWYLYTDGDMYYYLKNETANVRAVFAY